jgi:tetratricopeptide (TPR) repeat protein
LGDVFSAEHLVLLEQGNLATTRVALEAGIEHGIIVRDNDRFRFTHALTRHAFSTRLDPEQRQHTHLRIVQALERLYVDNPEPHTLEIARHLIEAGSLVDARMLMTYARRAGHQARALFAWSESVRYWETALSAAEVLTDISLEEKADLYFQAGFAHYGNQDVGPALDRFATATTYYRDLGEISRLAQSLAWQIRLRFMHATVPIGVLPPHVEELEAVLATLEADDLSLRGHIIALLAQAYRHARQSEKATRLAQTALATGRLADDNRLCTQAGEALGLAYLSGLQVESAITSWKASLGFARAAKDITLERFALTNLPLALNLQGTLEAAEVYALEGADVTKMVQDWGEHSKALSHLASITVARGNFSAAEQYTRETMMMVERSHYPWGGYRALSALACAAAIRGLSEEANQALDLLIEPGRIFATPGPIIEVFVRVFRQLILGYQSHEFTEYIAPLHDELMQVSTHDTYSLAPLCAMIELGELTLNPAVTERPAEMLTQALTSGVVFSSGWCFLIPRVLGVAAVMHEDWEQAENHFQHAMAIASSVNAAPELARTYLDYGRMMMIRPDRTERHGAAEWLEQAKSMFHEWNMLPHATLALQYTEILLGSRVWLENADSVPPEQISVLPSRNGTQLHV